MEIDWVAAIIGAAASLVTYGVLNEKVRRLEEDVHEMKEERTSFVTFKHFDAVILPLRTTLDSVQVDIKVLLRMLSGKKGESE